MKIQCDVCSEKEASVFCSADEAALCDGCDQRVHHANKLASKHQRFSLLRLSSSLAPLCDICQEKRALLFCQQDRAILCRDCEVPLHSANEHTQKHNRFLLTGIKLSAMVSDTSNDINNNENNVVFGNGCDPVPDFKSTKKPTLVSSEKISNLAAPVVTSSSTVTSVNDQLISGGSTSNISEYLMEMLPGWHFEDFVVDSASPAPFGFSKGVNKNDFEVNEDMLSFFDVEHDKKLTSSSITQCENFWVPQAPPSATSVFDQPSIFHHNTNGLVHGTKQQQEPNVTPIKVNRKRIKDDAFTVPQITSFVGFKRTMPFW